MSLPVAKRFAAILLLAALALLLLAHHPGVSAEAAPSADDPFAEPAPKPAETPQPNSPQPAPATASESAASKVPPLDEFLEQAMACHPDLEAARAKVQMAEAELRQAQYRVAAELTQFQNDWAAQAQDVVIQEQQFRDGKAPFAIFQASRTTLAATEGRAKLLLSQKPCHQATPQASAAPAKQELPKGPLVAKMREVLDTTTTVDFNETPLRDALDYLAEQHGVKFMISTPDFEAAGIAVETPVTLSIEKVPLGAALQAMEDIGPGIRFVLRDYGIVCTTTEPTSLAARSVSAVKFWEDSLAEGKPAAKP